MPSAWTRSIGQMQAVISSESAAMTPGPPALVNIAHTVVSVPCVGVVETKFFQRPCPVEHLLGSIGTQDASFVERRVEGRVRGGQRARVRCSSFLSRFEATDFEGNDRFVSRHLAGDLHKLSSIRNAFHIQHDDARVLILREHGQHVRLVDIRLIAEADELREAETLVARPVNDRRAERTRLGDETNAALRGHGRLEKGCVEGEMRIDCADAVGTQQPHAVRACDIETFLFKRRAFRADFPKPR